MGRALVGSDGSRYEYEEMHVAGATIMLDGHKFVDGTLADFTIVGGDPEPVPPLDGAGFLGAVVALMDAAAEKLGYAGAEEAEEDQAFCRWGMRVMRLAMQTVALKKPDYEKALPSLPDFVPLPKEDAQVIPAAAAQETKAATNKKG